MNRINVQNPWLSRSFPDLFMKIRDITPNLTLEVNPTRSGHPTLKADGIQVHSSYDPLREAESIAEKALSGINENDVLVICGLGLGYLAEVIRQRFHGKLVVVEPDLGMIHKALSTRSLSFIPQATAAFGLSPEDTTKVIQSALENSNDWKRVRLIKHQPSIKLNAGFYDELNRIINGRRNQCVEGLGILVVTPIYGGSLPVAHYCASAFERLGHRVELLDNEIYNNARLQIESISSNRNHRNQLTGLLTTLMAESITAKALDRAVDLVFLTAQSPMSPNVIRELRGQGIPAAFWFVEDWQYFTYWRDWAPLYDYFFTIQKDGFNDALARIGVKKSHYLPLAADTQVHKPLTLTENEKAEFGSTISHLGAGYHNRQEVFSGLTDLDFKLWGNDWDELKSLGQILQREGARLTTEESVKVFNATDININLHSSPFHNGVNPEGDYVNPRTFEIAACEGFQLVDERSLLPEMFKIGSEITTFKHESEVRELINHYRANPDERRRIATAARRRVLAEHTYEIRMAEVLEFIYSYETTPASRRHPDHIDNLLEEAEDDPELTGLLSHYKGKGVVTVEDIADDIRKREGELTDPEAIFLLMYEFRNWAKEKELV
ncbi:glycosyltransferase [bacterium]|nr:glycosyltransferase [bacterium]